MSTTTETEYHVELIDGQEVPKPLPKLAHATVQSHLIWTLKNQLANRPQWNALSELNVICAEDRLVPDITVVGPEATYIDGNLTSAAVLCIEIYSPGQSIGELFTRAGRLVKAGTPLCIIIWPEKKRIWSYTNDDIVEEKSAVVATPDGLVIDLSSLWN